MRPTVTLLALAAALAPHPAGAQEGLRAFERPVEGARDGAFNRAITRAPGIGPSATAMANSVTVSQSGRGNTLSLVLEQVNAGGVAAGLSLNGALDLE